MEGMNLKPIAINEVPDGHLVLPVAAVQQQRLTTSGARKLTAANGELIKLVFFTHSFHSVKPFF